MSTDQKPTAIVPNFQFDPVDEAPAPVETREEEIAKTREAFKQADYVPPEVKNEAPKPTEPEKPAKRKTAAKKPKSQTNDNKVPAFRRRRGRPSVERQHRFSMKSTERHLAFMYGIADERELVTAFEKGMEALAREVQASGVYDGRKVPADVMELAKALTAPLDD